MTKQLKLIECTKGYAETGIGGQTYVFARDAYGRFTSEVLNLVHRACLLSVRHYQEVDHEPADMRSTLDALEYADEADHLGDGDDDDADGDDDGSTGEGEGDGSTGDGENDAGENSTDADSQANEAGEQTAEEKPAETAPAPAKAAKTAKK